MPKHISYFCIWWIDIFANVQCTFISTRKIESGKVCNQMNERDNEYVISCSLVHHTSLECTSSMKIRLRVNVGPCMLVKKALCCMFLWLLIVHLESYDVENCIMWKNTSEITSILSVVKKKTCSFSLLLKNLMIY